MIDKRKLRRLERDAIIKALAPPKIDEPLSQRIIDLSKKWKTRKKHTRAYHSPTFTYK